MKGKGFLKREVRLKNIFYLVGIGLIVFAINHYQKLRKDMTLAAIQEKRNQKRKIYLIAAVGFAVIIISALIG